MSLAYAAHKMSLTGIRRTLFGDPSQPEPLDPRGGIQKAREEADQNNNISNPNQYENDAVCGTAFQGELLSHF